MFVWVFNRPWTLLRVFPWNISRFPIFTQGLPCGKPGPFQAVQTLRKERHGQVAGQRGWALSCCLEGCLEMSCEVVQKWLRVDDTVMMTCIFWGNLSCIYEIQLRFHSKIRHEGWLGRHCPLVTSLGPPVLVAQFPWDGHPTQWRKNWLPKNWSCDLLW